MSEPRTIWGRVRRSRILLAIALALTIGLPIYLVWVFPIIYDRQMRLMRAVHDRSVSADELGRAFSEQMMLNGGGWLLPIGVFLVALIFLLVRTFARSESI